MSQPSGIGRISLGSATAGVMLPVLLALGAQLVGPSQRLPDFFTLCFVLGIVLFELRPGCFGAGGKDSTRGVRLARICA